MNFCITGVQARKAYWHHHFHHHRHLLHLSDTSGMNGCSALLMFYNIWLLTKGRFGSHRRARGICALRIGFTVRRSVCCFTLPSLFSVTALVTFSIGLLCFCLVSFCGVRLRMFMTL